MYVLFSPKNNRYYIGSTGALRLRIIKHQTGRVRSTKAFCSWVLVYHEEFLTRGEAQKREYQVKAYKGGVAFKKLIGIRKIEASVGETESDCPAVGGVPPEAA